MSTSQLTPQEEEEPGDDVSLHLAGIPTSDSHGGSLCLVWSMLGCSLFYLEIRLALQKSCNSSTAGSVHPTGSVPQG